MKYNYIILALATLTLFSCMGDKVETPSYEGELITIRAYQEGATETRTTLIDGGTQVYWEPSDEIKLFFRGSGSRFISQNTENVRSADFTGSLNIVAGHNEGASGSNTLWGLYPYRADATSDGESVTTTLPAEQTGRAGSFAKNTHITLAKSNSFDLAFYNVCGGVRFSLTQEGIKRVTFEGNNGEALAGKIKLAFENGLPTVKELSDTSKVITLSAPNGGTFQTGQWYYIEALPESLAKGYKIVFYKESESAKLTSSSSVTFRRGVFGSLADADEDLMFKPTGGGDEPNPNDFIQFKDPIAKYACVEKFDTNKDGEVSYSEAATVTSLAGLFNDWTSLTEFDEILYFTSVTSTENVFTGLGQLKHITIPNNITTLGTFQNCSALDTVSLPAALTSLPKNCFDGCSSLKSVSLPTGITSIPDYAFRGCSSLETLAIPSTITSVGASAFLNCIILTGIDLPSGFKRIGNYAFENCTTIASVDFPASLTSIGQYAYYGCSALTKVILPNGVSVDQGAFARCPSLGSVVLPEDMTSIPEDCFYNCTKLATITWPTALTTIGNNAFAGCRFADSGYSLQLPSSITTIGSNAFGYLRHLILPATSPISIASDSFILHRTTLYVPSNMVEMYKARTNWNSYADQIRSISDYPASTVGGSVGEPIDLGLSVKWASWNLGASKPEEYGTYFAWGEIDPTLWDYSWTTYLWCNGSRDWLTKYCTALSCWNGTGSPDGKTVLDLEDDGAHVNWGGTWRMPTDAEWKELMNNCALTSTTRNGINGALLTAPNGNTIFLPFAGFWYSSDLYEADTYGYYWSSSLTADEYGTSYPDLACYVMISPYIGRGRTVRCNGYSVRPVCPKD